ncbi:MAG TPA: sialidase family protein [Smithellaceae bacterium]|nr:sialidase family protein [Smithellaceae bacterium]
MVILRGLVRDAQGSTDTVNETLSGAIIVQGASGDTAFGVCYTSSNGTFYTSAINLDVLTCIVGRRQTSDFSIEDFATEYDPSGVVSGALTANGDTTTIPGNTIITDTHKVFEVNSLAGRILEMRSGVDDGKTGVIGANTVNTITVGGISGGVVSASGWVCQTSTFSPMISAPGLTVLDSGSIVMAAGKKLIEGVLSKDVWKSDDNGVNWSCLTSTAEFSVRASPRMVSALDGTDETMILMGGRNLDAFPITYPKDIWKSTDGVSWSVAASNVPFLVSNTYYFEASVMADNSIVITGVNAIVDSSLRSEAWKSDDCGATWACMTSSAGWSGRIGHISVPLSDGGILIMGGQNVDTYASYNDVWRSDDYGASWDCVTSNAEWSARSYFGGVELSGGVIYITGGVSDAYYNDMWKSADGGVTWECVVVSGEWVASPLGGVFLDRTVSNNLLFIQPTNGLLEESWIYYLSTGGGGSSGTVITSAVSGDIYNIGGISGESTKNIIFTMWKNRAYSGM